MLCSLVEFTDILKEGIIFIFCVVGRSEHAVKKQDAILCNVCKYLTVDTLYDFTEDTNLQSDIQLYLTISIQYI